MCALMGAEIRVRLATQRKRRGQGRVPNEGWPGLAGSAA
jgi:hypothetical protein